MNKFFSALGLLGLITLSYGVEIRINQLGYHPTANKWVIATNGAVDSFYVRQAITDSIVYRGAFSAPVAWFNSGEATQKGDFSNVSTEGLYVIEALGSGRSLPFRIRSDAYANAYRDIQRAFYYWRTSTAIPEEFGGIFHRASGHADTMLQYHEDLGKSAESRRTVYRGWYDAGDYGKYIVNSGMSVAMLQMFIGINPDWTGDSVLNIPESGNGIPDLVDELRWQYDWVLNMQDDDGGVFFKVTPKRFEGNVQPAADPSVRYIIGKSTSSTLNFVGMTAQAYRRFKTIDPPFADTCLARAKRAWTWAKANNNIPYTQGSSSALYKDVSTGGYGDNTFTDEFFWAASELYLSTGDTTYKSEMGTMPNVNTVGWNSVGTLGLYSIALDGDHLDSSIYTLAKNRVVSKANSIVTEIATSPIRLPSISFYWGSNGSVASLAATLLVAYKATSDTSYVKAAGEILDYFFGKNPMGISYITGLGYRYPMNPHSRVMVSDGIVEPIPGYVVGGPNASGGDNALSQLVANGCAPAKCYVDVYSSYAANEIAINWQAPLAFLVGVVESVLGNSTTLPAPQVFAHTVVAYPTEGVTLTIEPKKDSYNLGEQVRIVAVADSPYVFHGWAGSVKTSKSDTTITVNGNMMLKALATLPGYNLIRNGNFSDSSKFWSASRPRTSNPTSYGRIVWTADSALRVDPLDSGSAPMHVYATQTGIPIIQGVTYTLELNASAEAARSISVAIGGTAGDYNSTTLNLSTNKYGYRFSFTANKATDENGWIRFGVGSTSTRVTLDDIKLYVVSGTPDTAILTDGVIQKVATYNFGARILGNSLHINVDRNQSYSIEIIDHRGKTLAIKDNQQNSPVHSLTAIHPRGSRGMYWVRVRSVQGQQVIPWVRGD